VRMDKVEDERVAKVVGLSRLVKEIFDVLVDLGVFPIWDIPGFQSQPRRSWRRPISFWSTCERNMPPALVPGSKLDPSVVPATSGYPVCHLFFCF
jgi:hypothetical protein